MERNPKPKKYRVRIEFEGDSTERCEKVHSTLSAFRDNLRIKYEIKHIDYSPYYSGHETADIREQKDRYEFLKRGEKTSSASLNVERQGSNLPLFNFPGDYTDFNVEVSGVIDDLGDAVLTASFAKLFQELRRIRSGR